MAGRECYHCKQWIDEDEPHDCWTTTEAALTAGLPEDLRDAWERLREAAVDLGEQRIYASHHSIMFSRRSCYFFVRPRQRFLEVCIFLGRAVNAPQVQRVVRASKSKLAHLVRVTHRDQVEPPLTDWIREAYRLQDTLMSTSPGARSRPPASTPPGRATSRTPASVSVRRRAAGRGPAHARNRTR